MPWLDESKESNERAIQESFTLEILEFFTMQKGRYYCRPVNILLMCLAW